MRNFLKLKIFIPGFSLKVWHLFCALTDDRVNKLQSFSHEFASESPGRFIKTDPWASFQASASYLRVGIRAGA